MPVTNKDLKKRILDISYQKGLSHIGSCLLAVDILEEIYSEMEPLQWKNGWDDGCVLSSGHAGLALYVVLEKHYPGLNAEEIYEHHGVHPDRCKKCYISCSAGSLGNGLGIAVGMALARPGKTVHCLISDGETNEGSCWEALRIAKDSNLKNLKVYLNANSFAAYDKINVGRIMKQIKAIGFPVKVYQTSMVGYPPFLQGLLAHYKVLTLPEYSCIMGHGWPEGFSEKQSAAQKRRYAQVIR